MYIIACRAHFCHLLGLGQVGHSPRETSGMMGPWTEVQCGQASSPLATPMHPWHPLHTPNSPLTPPRSPQCPLMPPIPLLAPEYLHSLPAPIHPWHPNAPYTPRNPHVPCCHLYSFWPTSTYIPCQPPIHPWPPMPLEAPCAPYATNTPSGPWVPTLPASPQRTPNILVCPDGPNTP